MGVLLFITSVILFLILVPIGIIWGVVEAFWNRGFKNGLKRIDELFLNMALAVDVFGNISAREIFNDVLIKECGYKFGKPGETISSVLGKNYRDKTLTKAGMVLRNILHKIDPNHSINSIKD